MADINTKVSLDERNAGHVKPIMRMMGNMIKDAFVDGLNEPYSSYTRNYRPETLVDAYQCAMEQYAANCRRSKKTNNNPLRSGNVKSGTRSNTFQNNFMRPNTFQNNFVKPNTFQNNFVRPNTFQNNFMRPNHFQNNSVRPNYVPRPTNFNRPTPMEIDNSTKHRRPNQFNTSPQRPYYPKYTVEELTCTEQNQDPYWYDEASNCPPYEYTDDPSQTTDIETIDNENQSSDGIDEEVNFSIADQPTPDI